MLTARCGHGIFPNYSDIIYVRAVMGTRGKLTGNIFSRCHMTPSLPPNKIATKSFLHEVDRKYLPDQEGWPSRATVPRLLTSYLGPRQQYQIQIIFIA